MKMKTFTLASGYVRDEELKGRYQVVCAVGRAGGIARKGVFNLFSDTKIREILKRHLDKRLRGYGHILLMSLNEGEVAHHINDKYVIGVDKKVHESMSSNDKDKHRAQILQWLKENNRVKYLIVMEVLKKQ